MQESGAHQPADRSLPPERASAGALCRERGRRAIYRPVRCRERGLPLKEWGGIILIPGEYSIVRQMRLAPDQQIAGSNPVAPIKQYKNSCLNKFGRLIISYFYNIVFLFVNCVFTILMVDTLWTYDVMEAYEPSELGMGVRFPLSPFGNISQKKQLFITIPHLGAKRPHKIYILFLIKKPL